MLRWRAALRARFLPEIVDYKNLMFFVATACRGWNERAQNMHKLRGMYALKL